MSNLLFYACQFSYMQCNLHMMIILMVILKGKILWKPKYSEKYKQLNSLVYSVLKLPHCNLAIQSKIINQAVQSKITSIWEWFIPKHKNYLHIKYIAHFLKKSKWRGNITYYAHFNKLHFFFNLNFLIHTYFNILILWFSAGVGFVGKRDGLF